MQNSTPYQLQIRLRDSFERSNFEHHIVCSFPYLHMILDCSGGEDPPPPTPWFAHLVEGSAHWLLQVEGYHRNESPSGFQSRKSDCKYREAPMSSKDL